MWQETWQHLIGLEIPAIEKIVRAAFVYLFLVLVFRIFGKRELAQLNQFDLVVLLLLSNTVQNAIIGNDTSILGGVIGALTLLLVNRVMVIWTRRSQKVDRLLEGEPTILIEDGKVRRKVLERERISLSQLVVAANRQGFDSLDEVDRCVLEPGGLFLMVKRKPTPDEARHGELLHRLDALSAQLARIESAGTAH